MTFPRYKSYKNSGIRWLGDVPGHWQVKRIKQLITSVEQGWSPQCESFAAEGSDEWGVLKVGCVNGGRFDPLENKALPLDLQPIPALGISKNDILISRANSRELVGSAAVADKDHPNLMLCDKLYRLKIHSELCLPTFLSFYLNTRTSRDQLELAATGASSSMLNIQQSTIREFVVAIPPLEEQRAITFFVERETSKIDALVSQQQILIELLKEKRRALIAHAVLRGLNAGAPMNASGADWIGRVPLHWQVVRLGTLFKEVSDPGNDDLPLLSVSIHHGVSDREFDDDELDRKVMRSEDRTKYKCVLIGDLVYNMMRAWQGGFGTVTVPGMVSPAYVVARPIAAIHTEFIEQVLRTPTAIEELRRHSHGVTDFRLRLYWDEFKSIKVPIPPILEQQDILAFLNRETAKIDALTTEAESGVSLLQERRMALIAAVVTGKIDVGVAAIAQEETEAAA